MKPGEYDDYTTKTGGGYENTLIQENERRETLKAREAESLNHYLADTLSNQLGIPVSRKRAQQVSEVLAQAIFRYLAASAKKSGDGFRSHLSKTPLGTLSLAYNKEFSIPVIRVTVDNSVRARAKKAIINNPP